MASAISELISASGLDIKEVIVGLVMEMEVVTQMPGYDFKVTIHTLAKDEHLLSRHHVILPARGQSLAEFRAEYMGKYAITVADSEHRANVLIKGRCSWEEKRYTTGLQQSRQSLGDVTDAYKYVNV